MNNNILPEVTAHTKAEVNESLKKRGFPEFRILDIHCCDERRVCVVEVEDLSSSTRFTVKCAWTEIDFADQIAIQVQDRIENDRAALLPITDRNAYLVYHYYSE